AIRAALLAAGLVAPAFAQLPDIIDHTIGRKVEDTVSRTVDRRVTDGIESRTGSLIDNKATRDLKDKLDKTLTPVNGVLEGLDNRLQKLLPFRQVQVDGNWQAIDHEWIVLVPPDRVGALQIPAVRILSRRNLPAAGLVMLRVQVSDRDDAAGRAQQVLRDLG